MKKKLHDLMTEAGERLAGCPWQDYPRPQLVRDSYRNLNGTWEFGVTAEDRMPEKLAETILVPFAPQSMLSGVHRDIPDGSYLWYRRAEAIPQDFLGERVLLHVGAADQVVTVFVNGTECGSHEGGYLEGVFDITAAVRAGENEFVLRVYDCLADRVYPYGKQTLRRGGMWYTPVSGIWKTVWLESVPETYVKGLRIVPDRNGAMVTLEGIRGGSVLFDGREIAFEGESVYIPVEHPRYWSPEDPYLYRFAVRAGADEVQSYFALRTLETKSVAGTARLCLNGRPYFFHGLLDQGYYSDGLYTPAGPGCFEEEILRLKALGFNTLRKHIKVEDERFYYECDRLGMIVFQDMVQNGTYYFLKDTVLPTAGLLRMNDRGREKRAEVRAEFAREMLETVHALQAHPCICYWTIFNEGWGQSDSSAMYEKLREADDSRWIDSASGWFAGGRTDVESRHVYFRRPKAVKAKKPFVLSEFGGYSWKPEGHCYNTSSTYGYGAFRSREALVKGIAALYEESVLPMIPAGLCAAIYTQVSDVEDETNGIFSYDRKVQKILPEEFAAVSAKLYAAMEKCAGEEAVNSETKEVIQQK
ncbi:MAG: glycoside hydrolase family 2 [Lachnospiraceae bacterium]|nr:glycoside hydrolase family 2 [Lachnospiraceae bacterium]